MNTRTKLGAVGLLAATLSCFILEGASATVPAAPQRITPSTPDAINSNGCVKTRVYASNHWISTVDVYNICSYTLYNVSVHVFNGPAGLNRYAPTRGDMSTNERYRFSWSPYWYAPPGSLTCGEIWGPGPNPRLWGRDCITS